MMWPQGDGAVVIRKRITETFQLMERDTAVHQRLEEVGPQRQRAIGVGKCGVVPAKSVVDDRQEIEGRRGLGVGGQNLETGLFGLAEFSRLIGFQGEFEDLGQGQRYGRHFEGPSTPAIRASAPYNTPRTSPRLPLVPIVEWTPAD